MRLKGGFFAIFFGVLGAIAAGFAIYIHSYTSFEKASADSRKLETSLETLKTKEQELTKKDIVIHKLNEELNRLKESKGNFNKLQDEIINKDTEISNLKQDLIKLQDGAISENKRLKNLLQSKDDELIKAKSQYDKVKIELDKCQASSNQFPQQISKKESGKDPLKKYEHKMARTHVGLHNTTHVPDFFGDIFITIEEVKNNKIYGFLGSKGFPSLQLNGMEVGNKLEYRTNFYYEIKPVAIGRLGQGSVDFLIIQYKELKD
ncbi:MAG: hypothetical protein A2139_02710 [Desulfobacca sp. RBG_16_60_12]|nr:MAG: hypothetical protein A2139_02710 [Desulfobacca sp. RBG_16_60_12]